MTRNPVITAMWLQLVMILVVGMVLVFAVAVNVAALTLSGVIPRTLSMLEFVSSAQARPACHQRTQAARMACRRARHVPRRPPPPTPPAPEPVHNKLAVTSIIAVDASAGELLPHLAPSGERSPSSEVSTRWPLAIDDAQAPVRGLAPSDRRRLSVAELMVLLTAASGFVTLIVCALTTDDFSQTI